MANDLPTTERQLNLVSAFLKAREPLYWAQIERLEGYDGKLSKRTLQKRFERDVAALRAIGLVITIHQERGGLRSYALDRGSCFLPPLKLSPEQRLLMFRVGVSYLDGGGAGPLADHLSRALLKLQAGSGIAAWPDELPPSFVRRSLHRRPAESKHLDAIGLALIERRRIAFSYVTPSRGPELRQVAPYALVARRGGWYLVAYDSSRKGERTFKLSRIKGEVSAVRGSKSGEFEVPEGFDPERSFSSEMFGAGAGTAKDVRVRFDNDVAFIIENEFAGIHRIEKTRDGIVLHLPQAYPFELMRYLGEFAGHWEVLAPAELREQIVARLRETLRSVA